MNYKMMSIGAALGFFALLVVSAETGIAETDQAETGMAEGTFSGDQQKAIEKIIREYVVKNPEIIREALIELEKRQVSQQEDQQRQGIAKNAEALFRSKNSLVAGNPNGDVTVVEFFDYNCGFCRRALPHITKLIENDKNVRVVFKELPIFGEKSEAAAKVVIASKMQGKYFEMHSALFNKPGTSDEAKALRIAAKMGLDMDKLKADIKDPVVDATINNAKSLANALGIQGTPFYLVGDRIIPGAPEDLYDQLVANIKTTREKGCVAAC